MKKQSIDIISIVRRALNTLDYRLMDHGWKVGYFVYNLLKGDKRYNELQLAKICYITLFHDIGAYKTEQLDSLMHAHSGFDFEIKNTLDHSIYGYLFLNEYEFFKEYADIILYHHFTYPNLIESECSQKELASIIFLADRMEILTMRRPNITTEELLAALKNPVFNQEIVSKMRILEETEGIITNYLDDFNLTEVLTFMSEADLTEEQAVMLMDMIPHTIDFRSEYTVVHTVATVRLSFLLGLLCNLDYDSLDDVYMGALLHDIGKISTPLEILEKNGRLTSYEFGIMKDHVVLSDYILNGCVSEGVVRIAARHHEKLDGSGYPKGLREEDLTLGECIVAVADILSALMGRRSYKEPYSKEKVCEIMMENKASGKLSAFVIDKALENYEMLQEGVDEVSFEATERYNKMEQAFAHMKNKYEK